jgi:hypothetical protein
MTVTCPIFCTVEKFGRDRTSVTDARRFGQQILADQGQRGGVARLHPLPLSQVSLIIKVSMEQGYAVRYATIADDTSGPESPYAKRHFMSA